MITAAALLFALLACCDLFGRAASRLGLPDLIGFFAAGLLFGASGLELVGPQASGPIPPAVWRPLADLGLAALMIGAGLAMPSRLPAGSWRQVGLFSLAILACLIPAFLSAPLLMDGAPDPAVPASADARTAYLGALALAVIVTSVPFLTRILGNIGLLDTPFGGTVLRTACLVDLVVWSLFPALVAIRSGADGPGAVMVQPLLTLGFLGGMMLLSRFGANRLAAPTRFAGWYRAAYAATLGAAALAAVWWLDVGVMLASLAFGLGMSGIVEVETGRLSRLITPLINRAAIPAYFALVGAGVDLDRDLVPALILGFLLWSSLIKIAAVAAAAWGMGLGRQGVLSYGLALNTRGGPGIALASLALGAGIVGEATFLAFVLASIVTAAGAQAGLRLIVREAGPGRAHDALFKRQPRATALQWRPSL